MRIKTITIHNFRSIKESSFNLTNYSILLGENNVGKTNVLRAIRIFYEDGGIKYKESVDFPKFNTDDKESWIEIQFLTTEDEQNNLRDEYKSSNKILKVRRYFKSIDENLVKTNQSNIYAYEGGKLSKNLFYGAKNISQAKLGKVIYIPEISKTDDTLKLSGPSPFREMLNFVMNKVVRQSQSFESLKSSFKNFNEEFKEESTKDGFSLNSLINDINNDLKHWQVKFGININPIKPDNIIKTLISNYLEDENLKGEHIDVASFGQGLQRHLIYTLIKLSTKYIEKRLEKKKDFSPDYTLILFEEPEAFLHPSQQEQLNLNLKELAQEEDQQIFITTHSPIFICKNITDLDKLIKINKENSSSKTYQLVPLDISNLINENMSMFKMFSKYLNDPEKNSLIKGKIQSRNLGNQIIDEEKKFEEESIKYFLWLDTERSCLFFAKHIIICEGASEKVLFDYLINNEWQELKAKHVYFLDALGKYNIHRYMNLFNKLGISHSIIYDSDNDKDIHGLINEFLKKQKNSFTKGIYSFDNDFESFLGINRPNRPDLKPLNIIYNYKNDKIDNNKIDELKKIVLNLI